MPRTSEAARSGRYALISFNKDGQPKDTQGVIANVLERLRRDRDPFTDVFIFIHGWQVDEVSALKSYDDWVKVMDGYYAVRKGDFQERRPGFRPLLIGIHWPSAPWEDPRKLSSVEEKVAFYTEVIGDPLAANELYPLLDEAEANPDPRALSSENEARLCRLNERSGLRNDEVGAAPGHDRECYDPKDIFSSFKDIWYDAVGSAPLRSLLAPLWVTTFWKMKHRALKVGQLGVHGLVRALQKAAEPERQVRFHLIGHSFGGIVCSSALQGASNDRPLLNPVHSLTLLQGALSLWSFAPVIPDTEERCGYFHPIIANELVSGPIVTTRSEHDRALGWFYRVAASRKKEMHLPRKRKRTPRYGAVGSYGLAGLTDETRDFYVQPGVLSYTIEPGWCYNFEASSVINNSSFSLQGAHSDFKRPELAAIVWEAATSR